MNHLIISTSKSNRERRKLQTAIKKKRTVLANINEKYETLKKDLDLIKHEYTVRIGSLYSRDNTLDLEIIKYKNILSLLKEGKTYEEIMEEIKSIYDEFKQEEITEEEFININKETAPDLESEEAKNTLQNIKKLFKELLMRFHPDLVMEVQEKKERDIIMKQINKAYAENDYDSLLEIQRMHDVTRHTEKTEEELSELLIYLENLIIKAEERLVELKETEWFGWQKNLKKAKKEGKDLFKQHETMLIDDILKKISILSSLRKQAAAMNKKFDL